MLQQIDMEMDDVELVGAPPHLVQHDDMRGDMAADAGEAQPLRHAGNQFRRGLGVAAGKQRHIMTFGDKLLGQPGDDPFGSPV